MATAPKKYMSAAAAEGAMNKPPAAPPKAPVKSVNATQADRAVAPKATSPAAPPRVPYRSAAAAEGSNPNNIYGTGDVVAGPYGTAGQKTSDGWVSVTGQNLPTSGQQAAAAATAQMNNPPAPRAYKPADPMAAANATNYTAQGGGNYAPPPPAPPTGTPRVSNWQGYTAPVTAPRVSNWQGYTPPPVVGTQNQTLPYTGQSSTDFSGTAPKTQDPMAYYNSLNYTQQGYNAYIPGPSAPAAGSGGGGGYGSYEGANFNPAGGAGMGGEYIVQPGDNIITIARRLGIDYRELIALNQLSNPDIIQPGQRLILPGGGSGMESFNQSGVMGGIDPYAVKDQWGNTDLWGQVYGGGGQGGGQPAPAPAPSAPMPVAPPAAPPVPGPNFDSLINLFATVPPGGIYEIPPALQQQLGDYGYGQQFEQLLTMLGFQKLPDIGINGLTSDYVRPASVNYSTDVQAYLAALPPQLRGAMSQFVLALMGQQGAPPPAPPVFGTTPAFEGAIPNQPRTSAP